MIQVGFDLLVRFLRYGIISGFFFFFNDIIPGLVKYFQIDIDLVLSLKLSKTILLN